MIPTVCVLLCTYNGEKYLREQLESVLSQENVSVAIMAHDDGSKDKTKEILREYNIPLFAEEHLGAADGFFYLMENAPEADFYAFCDQDDIWDNDKLFCAIKALGGEKKDTGKDFSESILSQKPMLYASPTRLVKENREFITEHKIDAGRSLTSRLFYSSISGNTIVFNRSLRDIAVMHHPEKMVMHDSWLVKLCICIGGKLVIDNEPHIDYRMHGDNVVGMELNLSQKIAKFKKVVNSKGEGQELIDICGLYGVLVKPEYRRLAKAAADVRADSAARKTFIKDFGIDFKNKGFNSAFAIKVRKGNL